jgi:hypothetical protein
MSRALALATILAACGGTPAPAPRTTAPAAAEVDAPQQPDPGLGADDVVDPTGIDWDAVSYATDDEALAIWARLGLDGENVSERLAWVPELDALREAMAKAILREGNFACPPIAKPLSCEKNLLEFPELRAEQTLTDPCLRRELALWALGEVGDDVLTGELAPDLIALAGLPPPEEELNRAALYRVEDTTLRLQMLDAAERAGNETIADENLGNLSASGLEAAVLQHHIDGALIALGVDGSLNLYLQAMVDPALRPETRAYAARELGSYASDIDPGGPHTEAIVAALDRARLAADCALAGAALDALEMIEGTARAPTLTRASKPDAYARALCVALHRQDESSAQAELLDQITPKGVVVEERFQDDGRVQQLWLEYPDEPDANRDGAPDVAEADPDGDGDPTTWVEAQRVPREGLDELPIWTEVRRALQTCKSAECQVPDQQVWFKLHWKKGPKGRRQLAKIERREIVGSCEK